MNAIMEPKESVRPTSLAELGDIVRGASGALLPRGGGTKPALSTPAAGTTVVEMGGLTGITEYNPSEFTFSARAGTPLAAIVAALAEHGQGLPFDPPLVDAGATLGGAIAAGLSGPRRVRYGPLRDFILGVQMVDADGEPLRGGGRVVKNAAGLDITRLMVGSLGRLAILTEATFKVFPSPLATGTVRIVAPSLADAVQGMGLVAAAQFDLEGLELNPAEPALYARLGGLATVLPQRLAKLASSFGGALVAPEDEPAMWRDAREFAWAPPGWSLAFVALEPGRVLELDAALAPLEAQRRYSAGGHMAWVALDPARDLNTLDGLLTRLALPGLLVRGPLRAQGPFLGKRSGQTLLAQIRPIFDPHGRFLNL